MSDKKILIIDDSATIRRLVDSELTTAGYQVLMAPTAEDGLHIAATEKPDLILLDHQLPGTTGQEVCFQLLENAEIKHIPVVASSTLRKKAYAEYVDFPNVVDMLPKPYTGELLITTVENALSTAAMVVQSQSEGTAVPEVINEVSDSDLAGTFDHFGLREIVDMLNNANKCGVLEIESESGRVWIYVDGGRIQAVTAAGVDPSEISKLMPESLSELAPVVKFTVGGRRCTEVDGIVELLDNKVLDPRLLRKLLRLQASVLIRRCFTGVLKGFRFEAGQVAPSLFRKLPLDTSLLSLLVEGAMVSDASELPEFDENVGFKRRAIRGQNLDRTGLSSRHLKLMNLVAEPISLDDLMKKTGWDQDEAIRVLQGFQQAELVEQHSMTRSELVLAMTSNMALADHLRVLFSECQEQISGKIVKDWLALKLMLRRNSPSAVLVEYDGPACEHRLAQIKHDSSLDSSTALWVAVTNENVSSEFDMTLPPGFSVQQLMSAIAECRQGKVAVPQG